MANNVAATAGTGTTFKTTDTAGVHTGHVNVDSLPALAAGTNAIGKLAANSGVDIGDVNVPVLEAALLSPGRASAATSAPGVLSTEDFASLEATRTSVQLIDDAIYADDAAFTPGTSKVMAIGFQADEGSTDSVDEGDVGAPRMTLDRKVITTAQPHTAGGLSVFCHLDIDETPTAQEVKASAGCLYKLRITNRATTIRYVRLYDQVAGSVTVGTTAKLDMIPVPGCTSADVATIITEAYGGLGLPFSTGLTIAATTGFADNDTGAPGTNDVIVSAYYK